MERLRRNILTGVLAILPFLITLWVMWLVIDVLIRIGRPVVLALARAIRPQAEGMANLLSAGWFQSSLALLVTLIGLYFVGAATQAVVGRRILRIFDRVMEQVPLARTIYGATRTLISSVRGTPLTGGQRVVLIEFPTPEMRAVGFVTATFCAADTGEELAAVYVPTTPNPTSGYVEVVPLARLVKLDWSVDDAMAFISRAAPWRTAKSNGKRTGRASGTNA